MTKISADALVEKIIELDSDDSSDATATNSAQRDSLQTDGPEGASNYDLDADIQRAQGIISENERLKARQKCKICKQAQVGMIFLPCGHILACTQCGPKTRNCTHCGEFIRATANVYLS
ncbi:baculoviral IAP repeat-containing protein 7-like [Littorina saxatilis]|uniref:RING-type domain-containing protein n=1 Tax=Littorina saxatilis TaxID=31220 RepID=A0AAN9BLT3_9CAEN